MLATKLTDKGQLVIPKPIRDALHLGKGSELRVSLEGGRVVLEPQRRKSGKKLGDWLPTMQVVKAPRQADLNADVEGYTDE